MTKIIAYYLPQFHEIPENNEWWGKGFTEWTNVKKAIPRFSGHKQPRIPINHNYYNLLDPNIQEWQSNVAQKYGIYGFCYYHYWNNGKLLLEKPAEQMLNNHAVTIPFCFSWANHSWRRTWGDYSKTVLMEQTYGGEKEWKSHFDYLLPFFLDKRYIKKNGKPIFLIYSPENIPDLYKMTCCWNDLAHKNHIPGICFASQNTEYDICKNKEAANFLYNIEYQPDRAKQRYRSIPLVFHSKMNEIFGYPWKFSKIFYNYDKLWKIALKQKPMNNKSIPGAFVDWDNTPRFAERGTVCVGNTLDKFEKYLTMQVRRTRQIYKSEYLFMFAWNEWGESAYLEPDELNGYKLLEAVRNALQKGDAD